MKIAIIESVASSPHLETAGEVALSLKKKNKVHFFWAGYNLPWNDWDLPLYLKIFGGSYKKKVDKFKNSLSKNGIEIDEPLINVISTCNIFVTSFGSSVLQWTKICKIKSIVLNFFEDKNLNIKNSKYLINIKK